MLVLDRPPDFVWQPDECGASGPRRARRDLAEGRVRASIRLRRRSRSRSRRSGPHRRPRSRRGRERAERLRQRRQPRRRRLPARGRGAPHRQPAQAGRRARPRRRRDLPEEPELLFAVAPARRGFVWREPGLVLLPDTQVFRKRPPRADKRLGRALASFADLRMATSSSTRITASGSCSASRRRRSRASRATTSSSRRGPALRPARAAGRSRSTSAPTPCAHAFEARRQGVAEPEGARARERPCARDRADRALRAAAAGSRHRLRAGERVAERLEAEFPYRETEDQAFVRSKPSRRIWRRRGRWTGSSAATSASARPRSRSGPRSLRP